MARPESEGTDANPFEGLTVARTSTVDRVVEELRRALFEGEVAAGTPLREVALAAAMDVSRSTIREALGVLVAEGLAVRAPNRGVTVTEVDPDAVHDVSHARVVLETAGIRRWPEASEPARRAVRETFDAFRVAVHSDAHPAELTAAHLAIHRSFVGLTESPRLMALADAVYSEIRLALSKVDRIRRNSDAQVRSHELLVDLLEADDVEGAAEELARHLADAATSMLDALHLE